MEKRGLSLFGEGEGGKERAFGTWGGEGEGKRERLWPSGEKGREKVGRPSRARGGGQKEGRGEGLWPSGGGRRVKGRGRERGRRRGRKRNGANWREERIRRERGGLGDLGLGEMGQNR